MADGQGRALGSGSIPDVPLRRKAIPQIHFFTVPRRNAGRLVVYYKKMYLGGRI